MITHQTYPSDVSNVEWAFVLPYRGGRPEPSAEIERSQN
jgi:hypothetical protein